ncbi:phage tail protein [Bacterioplanoides sp.]|uniref:phage tail protein n=1 Tax=Bacterioplanoides sp. TaxID=2066072 RepID=UPI003AFF6366
MSDPFLAEVRIFGGNFAPRGWAFCDGQLIPVAQNTALFSLIGTIYGGDGRTTFALPDLRERSPMHPGQENQGRLRRNLGQRVGSTPIAVNQTQVVTQATPDRGLAAIPSLVRRDLLDTSAVAAGYPSLAVNFIIATIGLFPSRS